MTARPLRSNAGADSLARSFAALLTAGFVLAFGCTPRTTRDVTEPIERAGDVRDVPGRPAVATVVRDGDPRAAIAVAVLAAKIDDAAGARVPVALGAVVLARLTAAGIHDVTVSATWDGYRVRALLPEDGNPEAFVRAARAALLDPIAESGPEDDAVRAQVEALAERPVVDASFVDVARCAESPRPTDRQGSLVPSHSTLERWRAAAHRLGRVTFGVVGPSRTSLSAVQALTNAPAWPPGTAPRVEPLPPGAPPEPTRAAADDPELPPRTARVTVLLQTLDAASVVLAARALGEDDGPLARRLRALDEAIVPHDITATVGASGGCLTVGLDVPHRDRWVEDSSAKELAAAVEIARQEAKQSVVEHEDAAPPAGTAASSKDPREAAELAAWWNVVGATTAHPGVKNTVRETTLVSVSPLAQGLDSGSPGAEATANAIDNALREEETTTVPARVAVERGQGSFWMLLASPCGTMGEGEADAGLTALTLSALAEENRAYAAARGVELSEWITLAGAGLWVRAERRPNESPLTLARRAAEVLGVALGTSTVGSDALARAQTALLAEASDATTEAFGALAEALLPSHPSWVFPTFAGRGFLGWTPGVVASRLFAMRRGPWRVAVLANEDATQGEVAVNAVDRFLFHGRSGRVCPARSVASAPVPGTYVASPSNPSSPGGSAWIALPLPVPLADVTRTLAARASAELTAAALDGPTGYLAHALSSGLASAWSAKVVGPESSPALVVRLQATPKTLDDAVAQVRALLARLQKGAYSDADRTRAIARQKELRLTLALDPKTRLVALWRGEPEEALADAAPSADATRALLAETLRDEALVIVVSRAPFPAVPFGTP